MSDETYSSARYRRLAREALGAANTLPPGVSRDTLLQMAQVWELAEQHADNTGPLSSTGRADQPAMQQQQQVQPDDEDEK